MNNVYSLTTDDLILEFLKHFPYLKTVKNILFKIPLQICWQRHYFGSLQWLL